MSAIYVMIHDTHSDIRTIRPYGRILHDGLTSYGLGGASEPCEGETSFESGDCRIIMGSIQNNAHAGVPLTSCVVETGQHIAVCDAMIYNRKSFFVIKEFWFIIHNSVYNLLIKKLADRKKN